MLINPTNFGSIDVN